MTDLEKAIAEVKHITGNGAGWDAWDFWAGGEHHDEPTAFNHAEATILNAVVSGGLIPATERDAASTKLAESRAYALALDQELRDRQTVAAPKMSESDFDCLILDAMAEAMKAMRKFPQPNYVISKIAEEAGEVVRAAIHCAEGRETVENLRGEMKQLIAMLYRLWIEGDQVHGLSPVSARLRAAIGGVE